MGFGLLFAGYATLFAFKAIPIELLGFFVIYLALDKLCRSDARFAPPKYASAGLFVISVVSALSWLSEFTGMNVPFFTTTGFEIGFNLIYYAALLVFHLLLYTAITGIAKTVGYDKGVRRVRFCRVTTWIFYAAELLSLIPYLRPYIGLPAMLFQLFWLIANAVLLFGCYRMIVTDEMEQKEEAKYRDFMEKYGRKHPPKAKDAPADGKNKPSKKKTGTTYRVGRK